MASFKVKTLYSPVYELLLSFSLYKRQTHLKYLDIGHKWKEDVEKRLSSEFQESIQLKNNLYFEDLSVILILKSPVKHNIEKFFEWLASLSAGEIYELVTPYLSDSEKVPGDLATQRDEYIRLLKRWNEQYFQNLDLDFLKELKAESEHVEERLANEKGEDIVQSVSRFVIETEDIQEVYLIPASHFQPMSLVDPFKGTLFITYPPKQNQDSLNEIVTVSKALSDERRLRMLQFLSNQSSTFTSIVKEIGMAKGNIHHHLLILRAARLLDIHLTNDKNTFYYQTHIHLSKSVKDNLDLLLKL